jgi:hypothetical protein
MKSNGPLRDEIIALKRERIQLLLMSRAIGKGNY